MSKKYKPTGWVSAKRMRAKAQVLVQALDNVYRNKEKTDSKPCDNDLALVEWLAFNSIKWLRSYFNDFRAEIHKNKIPPA